MTRRSTVRTIVIAMNIAIAEMCKYMLWICRLSRLRRMSKHSNAMTR